MVVGNPQILMSLQFTQPIFVFFFFSASLRLCVEKND